MDRAEHGATFSALHNKIQEVVTMKYWKISYYKTRNWIDTKFIKDDYAQGAINKARVKNIVDIEEISEEEYKARRCKHAKHYCQRL